MATKVTNKFLLRLSRNCGGILISPTHSATDL